MNSTINKNSKNFSSQPKGTVKGFKDKIGKDAEKAAFIREVAKQKIGRASCRERV